MNEFFFGKIFASQAKLRELFIRRGLVGLEWSGGE